VPELINSWPAVGCAAALWQNLLRSDFPGPPLPSESSSPLASAVGIPDQVRKASFPWMIAMLNCTQIPAIRNSRSHSVSSDLVRANARKQVPTILLAFSDGPFVCGWYTVDMPNFVPKSCNNCFQNVDTKQGSLSETTFVGIHTLSFKNSSAKASAERSSSVVRI
jgi:hypothetical protein